jgi:hypothetical protein
MGEDIFASSFCPKPFFVISAKDEDGKLHFLRKVSSIHVSPWGTVVDDLTSRFDTKAEANQILDVQQREFHHQNGTLACMKVKKIKFVAVIM